MDLIELEAVEQADRLVDEFDDIDLGILAASLAHDPLAYFDGELMARAVAAELRKRIAAGVRKWPLDGMRTHG